MKKTLRWLLVVGSFSLVAVSCGGTVVGHECATDADCDKGLSCFLTGFPGGFCTRGCTREGALNECPSGLVCTRTSTQTATFCSSPCNNDGQCRGGEYTCRAVTDSTQKACAP